MTDEIKKEVEEICSTIEDLWRSSPVQMVLIEKMLRREIYRIKALVDLFQREISLAEAHEGAFIYLETTNQFRSHFNSVELKLTMLLAELDKMKAARESHTNN